jgi:hypothetical protein
MNTKKDQNEPLYYVQCLTYWGTSIGGMKIQPPSPNKKNVPTEVRESFYKAHEAEFDYYADKKTISVIKPDSIQYAKTAEQHKLDAEAKKKEATRGNTPLPSIEIDRTTVPNEQMAHTMAASIKSAAELLGSEKADELCICKTAKGEQCKRERVTEKSVCGVHYRQILKGANVESIFGTIMTEELADDPNY